MHESLLMLSKVSLRQFVICAKMFELVQPDLRASGATESRNPCKTKTP